VSQNSFCRVVSNAPSRFRLPNSHLFLHVFQPALQFDFIQLFLHCVTAEVKLFKLLDFDSVTTAHS
jgi:hypothetical protein